MAGVMALAVDKRLHVMCSGCIRADIKNNCCIGYNAPKAIWAKGKCWAWDNGRTRDEYESQFQQLRSSGTWEDPLSWLAATKPPSIREKEAIMHLRGGYVKGSGSKSGKKRKKPRPHSISYLFEN